MLWCVAGLVACDAGDEDCTPRALNTAWGEAARWEHDVAGVYDPFSDHRPASVECPPSARVVEGEAFEIDTGACNYAVVRQVLAEPLLACEALTLTVAHFPLVALQPAEAHVAIAVGGETLWERTIPIPAPETGVFEVTLAPEQLVPAGESLVVHLHNHGNNTWYLSSLRVGPRAILAPER